MTKRVVKKGITMTRNRKRRRSRSLRFSRLESHAYILWQSRQKTMRLDLQTLLSPIYTTSILGPVDCEQSLIGRIRRLIKRREARAHSLLVSFPNLHNFNFSNRAKRISGTKPNCSQSMGPFARESIVQGMARFIFSAKSVLQVNEMLVPDEKHSPQMSIFLSVGHNMTTYLNTVTEMC